MMILMHMARKARIPESWEISHVRKLYIYSIMSVCLKAPSVETPFQKPSKHIAASATASEENAVHTLWPISIEKSLHSAVGIYTFEYKTRHTESK